MTSSLSRIGLYSPPHFKRRLPRKEPRPQQGKSMTIAAGFRCRDGVVLCTDSEHTAGESKFYEKKIFEAKSENATVYVAGAGHDIYIRSAAQEIESEMSGRIASHDQIKIILAQIISSIYENHFAASRQAHDQDSPTMTLLLAVITKTERGARLYRIEETGGISEINIDQGLTVTGTNTAESLAREQAGLLYNQSISVYAMKHLAVHIIRRVTNFASFCGPPVQLACLSDDGAEYLDNSPSPKEEPEYLWDALHEFPYLIEGCVDTVNVSDGAFEGYLNSVVERLREVRAKRKIAQRYHHPIETNGWVW